MSVDTPEELQALRDVGGVVAHTIRVMRRAVRPGITTAELDALARREFARQGRARARSWTTAFPGTTCISVNDEAVHGIPGPRRLRRGDLVKLDVTAELDGFYADACRTVVVGEGRPQAVKLVRSAEHALAARAGRRASRRRGQRDRRRRAALGRTRAASRSATA